MRALLIPALLTCSQAYAADRAGRVGLGADAAFTGGPAAHITYYTNDRFGIQGTFGANIFSPQNGGSTTTLTVGGAVIYKFVDTEDTDLGGHLAVSYSLIDSNVFRIMPGFRPELHVSDSLSLHATVGLSIAIVGANSANTFLAQGTTIALGGTGLLGGAGFTFYL